MLTKIPKVMNFYWDGSPMSYLHYMTIISFKKFNPDWKIIVHQPTIKNEILSWDTHEQKIKYVGKDYYHKLKKLSFVTFNTVDFNKIGFNESESEVFKSDYLRWYLLSNFGGGWSDFDILYINSINNIKHLNDSDTFICFDNNIHIIGFFLSKEKNEFFKQIYDSTIKNFDKSDYQSIGSKLLNKLYPSEAEIATQFPHINLVNIPKNIFYPIDDGSLDNLFLNINLEKIYPNTVGVHWYNGSNEAKNFNNLFKINDKDKKNTIIELINKNL